MTSPKESQEEVERRGMRPGTRLLLLLVLLALIAVPSVWILVPMFYARWKAQGLVLVGSPYPKMPMEIREPLVPLYIMDRFVADQAVHLKDDSLLSELLTDPAIRNTQWFQSQPGETDGERVVEALEDLRDDLGVYQIPDTNYLRVTFSTEVPQDAPVIVNTAIEKYVARVAAYSEAQWGRELREYEARRTELEGKLERIRQQKQTLLSTRLGVPGLREGLNVVGETWRALAAEVTRLEAKKLEYQAAYENLRGVDPGQILITPDIPGLIEQDPRIARLRDKKLDLELELAANSPETPENKEALQTLQKQLGVVDKKLIEHLAQLEKECREYQLYQAETLYLNATQAELRVRDLMLEAEAKQRDIDRGLAEYRRMEEKQLRLEERFFRIDDHINGLRMLLEFQGTVRVRPIGQAQVPDERDRTVQIRVTAIALAMPVVFGILLLIIRVFGRRALPQAR